MSLIEEQQYGSRVWTVGEGKAYISYIGLGEGLRISESLTADNTPNQKFDLSVISRILSFYDYLRKVECLLNHVAQCQKIGSPQIGRLEL